MREPCTSDPLTGPVAHRAAPTPSQNQPRGRPPRAIPSNPGYNSPFDDLTAARGQHRRLAGARGFTLIEILIVVAIIAIAMGVVALSVGRADQEYALQGVADRLALRIEMGRDRALQSNREWGLFFADGSYRFAEYDAQNRLWMNVFSRGFEQTELPVIFKIEADSYEGIQQSDGEEAEVPDIVLFSSGEVTPFVIQMTAEVEEEWVWSLASDGFSVTEGTHKEER